LQCGKPLGKRGVPKLFTHSGKPTKVSRDKSRNEYRGQWDNQPKESRSNTYAHNPEEEGYYKGYRDTRDSREVRCYECEGKGLFASECPTRVKRTQSQNSPGRRHPSGRSSRPRSPRDESRREGEGGLSNYRANGPPRHKPSPDHRSWLVKTAGEITVAPRSSHIVTAKLGSDFLDKAGVVIDLDKKTATVQ
jgi:hypothetical protein